MNIFQQRYAKVHIVLVAVVLATVMYAAPMLVSEMTGLMDVPTAQAGDHVYGDGGD